MGEVKALREQYPQWDDDDYYNPGDVQDHEAYMQQLNFSTMGMTDE